MPLTKLPEEEVSSPETLTAEQAREDVAMLKYLFETAYSGYDHWKRKGIDFDGLFAELDRVADQPPVSVKAIEKVVATYLQNIQDGHLSMRGHSRQRFFRHRDAYFTDLLVERSGDGLRVVDSGLSDFKTGDSLKVPQGNLFPTLSPKGCQHFLIGTLSRRFRNGMLINSATAGQVRVPLHPCRLMNADFGDESVFRLESVDRIAVIRACSFSTRFHKELLIYQESAKKLHDQKDIILNIWGNGGGSSNYSYAWVEELNDFVGHRVSSGRLYSPAIIEGWANEDIEKSPSIAEMVLQFRKDLPEFQQNPRWLWKLNPATINRSRGSFAGRVIVLVNRKVASSGELTTSYAQSFPNHLIVGENTAGIGAFGEVRTYILPNSKIFLGMPSKLFLEKDIKEGSGYMPSYWLDTSHPIEELAKWIRFPEKYQFSLDLPKTQTSLDCETWLGGVPEGIRREEGVSFGYGSKFATLQPDETQVAEGHRSALLSGDAETRSAHYYYLSMPDRKGMTVTFSVRGENIQKVGEQIDNAYIGFVAETKDGKSEWFTKFYSGSFDWQKETISIPWKANYKKVVFSFMFSVSGKLWLDDVKFSSFP